MYTNVNFYEFCRAFETSGRNNQFSYDGKVALFDYLEQLEEDIGEKIELDVIALCCEYCESTIEEALQAYSLDSIEQLESKTTIIPVSSDTIIYVQF